MLLVVSRYYERMLVVHFNVCSNFLIGLYSVKIIMHLIHYSIGAYISSNDIILRILSAILNIFLSASDPPGLEASSVSSENVSCHKGCYERS